MPHFRGDGHYRPRPDKYKHKKPKSKNPWSPNYDDSPKEETSYFSQSQDYSQGYVSQYVNTPDAPIFDNTSAQDNEAALLAFMEKNTAPQFRNRWDSKVHKPDWEREEKFRKWGIHQSKYYISNGKITFSDKKMEDIFNGIMTHVTKTLVEDSGPNGYNRKQAENHIKNKPDEILVLKKELDIKKQENTLEEIEMITQKIKEAEKDIEDAKIQIPYCDEVMKVRADFLSEIETIQKGEIEVHLMFSNKLKGGRTGWDTKNNRVVILIGTDLIYSETNRAEAVRVICHELLHAYQYLIGDISFKGTNFENTGIMTGGGYLYDYYDEEDGVKRATRLGDGSPKGAQLFIDQEMPKYQKNPKERPMIDRNWSTITDEEKQKIFISNVGGDKNKIDYVNLDFDYSIFSKPNINSILKSLPQWIQASIK